MSYRRRHRWFRRMALGLAFASVMVAGRASVAAAKPDPGPGSGSRYVVAGGWSGEVDMDSGIPRSAGIPEGDEQFLASDSVQVIPYLSHGILTQADADAAAAKAIHDPYLTDVFVRQGESLGGPDGDTIAFANAVKSQQPTVIPYLSHGVLTQADADALAAKTVHDPFPSSALQRGVVGDELAFANAIQSQQPTVIPYLSHGLTQTDADALAAQSVHDRFVPGVTDFGQTLQTAALRPDDRADRFVPSDVPSQPQMVSSDSGSTVEWSQALMVGFGALVLVLGLGLAIGYLRRPRLAGL
jgi:hypothetical protein